MKCSALKLVLPLGLVVVGIAIGATSIYIGETDDAPGAALIGILLMIGMVVLGATIAWRRCNSRLGERQQAPRRSSGS